MSLATATATRTETSTISLTPQFKLVFLSIVSLTVLAMVLSCSMIFSGVKLVPGGAPEGLLQALVSTWKLGFGAMIGLVGGKAL
jgi:hypothetical protein